MTGVTENASDLISRVLRGELDLLEGCRHLVTALSGASSERRNSPSALAIRGFVSETDGFPRGDVRPRWDDAALARLDAEYADYLDRVGESLMEDLRTLLAELEP